MSASTTITIIYLLVNAVILIGCPWLLYKIFTWGRPKPQRKPRPVPPAPVVVVQQPVGELIPRWTPDRKRLEKELRQEWAYEFAQAQFKR